MIASRRLLTEFSVFSRGLTRKLTTRPTYFPINVTTIHIGRMVYDTKLCVHIYGFFTCNNCWVVKMSAKKILEKEKWRAHIIYVGTLGASYVIYGPFWRKG